MKETVKTLKAFKKYLNGKGKKYPMPGAPDVNAALDVAIKELSLHMANEDFKALVGYAAGYAADIANKELKKEANAIVRRGLAICKKFSAEG